MSGDKVTRLPALQGEVMPVPTAPIFRGVPITGMDDSLRMAKVIVASNTAPKSLVTGNADPIAAVWTAIQLGAEVGLPPMCSVQNIAVINGKPGLYGPAQLAVVQASGLLADIDEGVDGEGEERHAYCIVTRRGRKAREFTFSMADAKRARLTGKPGPWQDYPDRMLLARARSFALRDIFPDVLMGLAHSVEELRDIPLEPTRPAARPAPVEPAEDLTDEALGIVDPETGELPDDGTARRMAVRRGAAPPDEETSLPA
jgi:RecT family